MWSQSCLKFAFLFVFYFLLLELVVGWSVYWVQILYCWLHTLLRRECTERCKTPFGLTFMRNVHELLFTVSALFGKLDGTVFCPTFLRNVCFWRTRWNNFWPHILRNLHFFWGGGRTMETFLVLTLSLVVWTSAGPVVTFQHNSLVLVLGTLRLIFG
jgi:hypothetical protein